MAGDGAFADPQVPDGERTTYRGVIGDREIGTGEIRITARDDAYEQHVDMLAGGAVAYAMHATFSRRGGTILAEDYDLTTSHGDRVIAREHGVFRDVEILQFGGQIHPYPRSVTPLLTASLALRGLDFHKGATRDFALWLANSVFWDLHVKVEKRERVTVPAGAFDAWRVRVRPSFSQINGALDKIVNAVLPPFVLHFDAEPAHRMLRFEFPTGPFPWNPRATIEMT
jgi:hypothetical protein